MTIYYNPYICVIEKADTSCYAVRVMYETEWGTPDGAEHWAANTLAKAKQWCEETVAESLNTTIKPWQWHKSKLSGNWRVFGTAPVKDIAHYRRQTKREAHA